MRCADGSPARARPARPRRKTLTISADWVLAIAREIRGELTVDANSESLEGGPGSGTDTRDVGEL